MSKGREWAVTLQIIEGPGPLGSTIKADSPRDGAWRNQPSQSHQGGLRSRSRRECGQGLGRGRKGEEWPVQGLGPTGVSGVNPRHKRPGSGCPLRCLVPLVPGVGDTSQASSPSSPPQPLLPLHPRGVHPEQGAGPRVPDPLRDAHGGADRAPAPAPAPMPGWPSCGHDPLPSQARSLWRAAQEGSAWRPRGARRRRVPYPAGGRRKRRSAPPAGQKRGAPLPAIVRQRPYAERAGDPGGGEHPPAGSPALTPHPHSHARSQAQRVPRPGDLLGCWGQGEPPVTTPLTLTAEPRPRPVSRTPQFAVTSTDPPKANDWA